MKSFKKLGKKIQYYRELQGKTIEELALETSIDIKKLELIERGEVIFKLKTLEKISLALNIDLENLLDFD